MFSRFWNFSIVVLVQFVKWKYQWPFPNFRYRIALRSWKMCARIVRLRIRKGMITQQMIDFDSMVSTAYWERPYMSFTNIKTADRRALHKKNSGYGHTVRCSNELHAHRTCEQQDAGMEGWQATSERHQNGLFVRQKKICETSQPYHGALRHHSKVELHCNAISAMYVTSSSAVQRHIVWLGSEVKDTRFFLI